MSEKSATERLEFMWRWIYRGSSTIVALVLTVAGIAGIVWASAISAYEVWPKYEIWHHIIRDLGIAALVSGFLSTAYEYLLRGSFLNDANNGLRKVLRERDDKLDELNKAGVTGVHPRLTNIRGGHIAKGFRRAKHIRILETWSGNFAETTDIGEALREATKNGVVNVRILLAKPSSKAASCRAKDLNVNVAECIKEDIRQLKRLCDDRPHVANNIEVRFYDATPAIIVHGYDDRNIVGIPWRQGIAQWATQLESRSGLGKKCLSKRNKDDLHFARAVDEHFKKLWEDNSTVDAKKQPEWKQV